MNRREFLCRGAIGGVALAVDPWVVTAVETAAMRERFPGVAEAVLEKASGRGASFVDFHVMQIESERVSAREDMIQGVSSGSSIGCSVRVLVDGAWGFAASSDVTKEAALALVDRAVSMAREQAGWMEARIEIERLAAHVDRWEMAVAEDPFAVPVERKAAQLLAINERALAKGAKFCQSSLAAVREHKWLANSVGSRIEQTRVRVHPRFGVTVVDEKRGGFASRASLAPPRAAGYEYVISDAFLGDVELAAEQAAEKLKAPSVRAGTKDLVIAPSNLWLTIHETVGHPTELDRALGYEANYAGTSFCTPDKLDRLQYASEIVTLRGDRTAEGGLSTIGYDDDGVKTAEKEFNIIDRGVFRNFQMALGQAQRIGKERSNGCAYADGYDSFPIQRMPNISLQPGVDEGVTVQDLIADVEDGLYVVGNGSWSIDQQRYNFQFTGQVFHRIRNGKLDGMVKDAAYQGNSVAFWNACDGLGGSATYELGGAFNCGKGQPGQVAPVSHGAVPARFRRVNVLNTVGEAGDEVATGCDCSGGRDRWA
ncbi:MAG: TldD/PmbA family protein [Verrucomicrobiota bacterium]